MIKNKQLYLLIFIIIISFAIITAQQTHCKFSKNILHKPSSASANNFDGNRIDCDVENNGMFVSQNVSGGSGLEWPKGNNTTTVYNAGIWLGGIVNDTVRVSAAEYGFEDIAAVRVGYLLDVEDAKDDKDTPDIDESTMLENIFAGPSFGATLNLLKLTGLDLSIDYAMFMTEYFDDNHVITLRFGR